MKNPLLLGGMSVLEWLSYHTSDGCIGLSPGIVEGIRRRAKRHHPVAHIPNGADLDVFRPGRRDLLDLEGVGPNDFVAAFTGAHGSRTDWTPCSTPPWYCGHGAGQISSSLFLETAA